MKVSDEEILEHLIKVYGDDEKTTDLKIHWNENIRMIAKKQKEEPQKNIDQLWQNALKLYFG